MSQTYKWGDKVYVNTQGYGSCHGIVLEDTDGDIRPIVTYQTPGGVIASANFPLRDISPRVVEPAPRTWRLPEVGDTIEVVRPDRMATGMRLKINLVSWSSSYPLVTDHGVFDLSDVKLVRLHDDPSPEEPTPADHVPDAGEKVEPKQDPWSGPCDPIGDLKAMMKLDAHRKIGLSDHVVDANKKVEPTFDPVTKARHYNLHPSGVECITIAKHMNFCLGSALKYILRVDNKGTPIQDLRKAIQFLGYEIKRRQELEASRGT
jgi:hypothetical protein